MKLSIITTLYYSAPHLNEFYNRAKAAALAITDDYEFIIVNDGSPDNALDLAVALHHQDPRVTVIDFSRNFGHFKALMTGHQYATGDYVLQIDSDLEEDPLVLHKFHETLQNNPTADVAFGVQDRRKGSWFERISGSAWYYFFNLFTEFDVPHDHVTARLMSQRYSQALAAHKEHEFIMGGMYEIAGFEQIPVYIKKTDDSETTYTLSKKLAQIPKAVTAFSNRPLIYIAYLGFAMLGISGLYTITMIWNWIQGNPPEGFSSLIVSIWFVGGIITFCLGVIAIYLSVIFTETKQRPYTIIRHIYKANDHD